MTVGDAHAELSLLDQNKHMPLLLFAWHVFMINRAEKVIDRTKRFSDAKRKVLESQSRMIAELYWADHKRFGLEGEDGDNARECFEPFAQIVASIPAFIDAMYCADTEVARSDEIAYIKRNDDNEKICRELLSDVIRIELGRKSVDKCSTRQIEIASRDLRIWDGNTCNCIGDLLALRYITLTICEQLEIEIQIETFLDDEKEIMFRSTVFHYDVISTTRHTREVMQGFYSILLEHLMGKLVDEEHYDKQQLENLCDEFDGMLQGKLDSL